MVPNLIKFLTFRPKISPISQKPDLFSSSLTLNWIKWLQNLRLNSYAIPLNSKCYEESLNLT